MLADITTRLQARVRLLGAGIDSDGAALTPATSAVLRAEIEADFAELRARFDEALFPKWPVHSDGFCELHEDFCEHEGSVCLERAQEVDSDENLGLRR